MSKNLWKNWNLRKLASPGRSDGKVMWASIIGYAYGWAGRPDPVLCHGSDRSELGLSSGEGGLIATYTLIGTVLGGYLFASLRITSLVRIPLH